VASALHAAATRVEEDPAARAYMAAIAGSSVMADMTAHRLPLEWAQVTLLSDDPAKVLGLAGEHDEVFDQVKLVLAGARDRVTLVSPYFVPGDQGVDVLASMAKSGVKIDVLTNSLAATDVPAVNAGYAKRRKPLLVAGVRLFELEPGVQPRRVPRSQGSTGASGQSLHAKTFTVDDEHVFVGSFNFDPRSARLNTEMGFVISSPALSRAIATGLNEVIESRSYRLRLNAAGDIEWIERLPGGNDLVYDHEPGVGFWERLGVDLLSILPIESQL
jgi:putative cardiolipin synthase